MFALVFGVIIFAIFMLFFHAYLKPIQDVQDMLNSGRI